MKIEMPNTEKLLQNYADGKYDNKRKERLIEIARRHWQDYVEDNTYTNANCCASDYEYAYADMEAQRDEAIKRAEDAVSCRGCINEGSQQEPCYEWNYRNEAMEPNCKRIVYDCYTPADSGKDGDK